MTNNNIILDETSTSSVVVDDVQMDDSLTSSPPPSTSENPSGIIEPTLLEIPVDLDELIFDQDFDDIRSDDDNSDTDEEVEESNNEETTQESINTEEAEVSNSEEVEQGEPLKTTRAKTKMYVTKYRLTHRQIRGLLKLLREELEVAGIPASPITLLDIKKTLIETRTVAPGQYYHIGIKKNVTAKYKFLSTEEAIELDICIDGVPLVKSSKLCMWPVLGAFVDKKDVKPFIIGLYVGYGSPKCVSEYLEDYVMEVDEILSAGGIVVNNRRIPLKIRAYCCDAPARAFLASTKYHSARHGCSKCTQMGTLVGHTMVYEKQKQHPRTDANFRDPMNSEHINKSYHNFRPNPLELLNTNMVTQIPIEPMHLIDLGVTKKILVLMIENLGCTYFASKMLLQNAEKHLLFIKSFTPIEFQRKPRPFCEVARYKATEFRQFLLYVGVVILRDTLKPEVYTLFLKYHCAVRLLYLAEDYDYAEYLLECFVDEFDKVFPLKSRTFNVHNLLHITEDSQRYGFESMSSYKFENYLQIVKSNINSSTNIFRQVVNGLAQGKFNRDDETKPNFGECVIDGRQQNNHCFLKDGSIVQIKSVSGEVAVGKKYLADGISDFYSEFCDSENLHIEYCNKLNGYIIDPKHMSTEEFSFNFDQIAAKFYRMPYQDRFVVLPLIHYIKN